LGVFFYRCGNVNATQLELTASKECMAMFMVNTTTMLFFCLSFFY